MTRPTVLGSQGWSRHLWGVGKAGAGGWRRDLHMTHSKGLQDARNICDSNKRINFLKRSTCLFHNFQFFLSFMCFSYFTLFNYMYYHDDVIKWKHFPHYWPFVRGIHWSPVNSPHKDQWRGALMFSLICTNSDKKSKEKHFAAENLTTHVTRWIQIF